MTIKANDLDVFIVSHLRDFHLLRIFMLSYQAHFQSGGGLHLLISYKEKKHLASLCLPKNVNIHYKEDAPKQSKDDFRNQMYLKLSCDLYARSEHIWMVDSDYLIMQNLFKEDFFSADKPHWYYRGWSNDPAEQTWREATESFLGARLQYQWMEEPQYVFQRDILQQLRKTYDLEKIFSDSKPPSEFMIYGHYAWENFREKYHWRRLECKTSKPLGFKINQRPPTYSILDENVTPDTYPGYKYYVFWSFWEYAEKKMLNFLSNARHETVQGIKKQLGKPLIEPSLYVKNIGQWQKKLTGFYSDSWMFKRVVWKILNIFSKEIYLKLETIQNKVSLIIIVNGFRKKIYLEQGEQIIKIPLKPLSTNKVALVFFKKNSVEENTGRKLYARIIDIYL